jgi:hypothetical protein|mmetsp:Transcript_10206/g.28463  ORF Transcript_10206/g.28463 Transcript_10206/m.28463 type:complete len:1247 (+) Transcript_10206:175-3915(+)
MLPEETHYLKTMSGSRVLCQNTSTFEPQFDIDLAGDLSLDILSTIIDAGFVRVAVAAVGLGCGEGPFKFLSANHASYSCKKVLKALLESSEASTNERSKGVHRHAAKELAEIVVIMLKTGAIRQPPFLDLLHFIASLQAFSELQKALMKCEYLNILSDAAIYDAVFPVMNLSEISPQSPHFFTHVGKLRVVSSKPRFSFFSAEQSTKAAVLCSRGKTSEQTHTKRSSSNNLPEKHIMSPPRKFPRSLKRSFEVFSKKTAVRCCRASQLRSAFGFFSEEVGENIFMSDFPNALAHGRRYRFVNSTAPDTCAGQRKACNVARKAPNSSKCWSSIATGQSPRSKREPSKFSPFMQLSLFALVSEFAIHCQVMHATHPFEAPMIPKTIARAFSTVSASLYFEHQPFKCCGDHPYLEEVNARAYLPKLLKDSSFYSLDLFLARLRGHSDSLWMSCVFWGELSARHCLTLEWLLVTLTSYLENAPALYGRDTTISIEILIHIRFLLSAALSSSVKTCNKSSLWGIICLWIRAACVINTQIAQTRSSPSLAQMMTKLFLGEHGSISLVQKYMDVALADFESKRRPSGINYEDTHSSDLNPCYVVKSYFTSITQLYLILHSNATSEDNHEFQHSDQRHLSAILIMLARLKCIFEPRSGLATRKYEDIMDPCVGTLTYPNRICLGDHMCINSLALAQVTLSTLFYLNVDSPESLFAYFHVIFISFLHTYITRFKNIPLDQPGCDELIAKHLILLTSLTRILKSEGMDTLHKSGFHSVSSLNRLCGRSRVSKTCVCSTTQKPVGNYTTCSDYVIQHHLAKFVINEIGLEHDIFHQQALRVKSARMDRCHAPGGINKVLNSKVTDIVDLFHMTRKDPQKASADVKFLKGTELSEIPLSCSPYEVLTYFVGRKLRRLYDAHRIHIHVLELVLATFATSTRGNILWNEIPARKCTSVQLQDWTEAGYRSLRSHVNCRANASAQNLLLSHRHVLSWDEIRLLRISCESLFEPSKYTSLELIGRGSYADVYHCSLSLELKVDTWNDAAAKVFESSGQWQTSSVFSEIQVLEEMQKEAFVVKLCDYGIAFGHAFIIMRQYPASLKCWRASQNYSIEAGNMCLPIQLHLNVFSLCVDAVCALSDFGVVHYDIKADNFLLEPETSCSVKDFWDPSQERWNEVPPFRVLISDFGESRRYAGLHNAGTLHSHGTEYIKAPEMLMISKIASIDGETPDRRNCSDCGDRVDAWALGCLLFEILANEYM